MLIEHRHVTVIDLRDGKARCFSLRSEHGDCQLSVISKDDVLQILCSESDLDRLRQVLGYPPAQPETTSEHRAEELAERTPTAEPLPTTAQESRTPRWSDVEWLAYN